MSMFRFANRVGLSCAIAVCAFVVSSRADDTCRPSLVSTFGSFPADIELVGDIAYIADEGARLSVFDVSVPGDPVLIGRLDGPTDSEFLGGDCFSVFEKMDVAVQDGIAYVAAMWKGVYVIDVREPANPVGLATILPDSPERMASGVDLDGDTLCVANTCNVLIVDVTDPAAPVVVSVYEHAPGELLDVVVRGDIAAVVSRGNELFCLDISDPGAPALLGTVRLGGAGKEVVLDGTLAYVAVDSIGLQIVDIGDPANPRVIGSCAVGERGADGVAVAGGTAYISVAGGFDNLLATIDVSDPSNPVLVGSVDTPAEATGVAADGGVAYVVGRGYGLQVFDASDPSEPQVVGTFDALGSVGSVAAAGDVVYLTRFRYDNTGVEGLVVDMSVPGEPVVVGGFGAGCFSINSISLFEDPSLLAYTARCGPATRLFVADVTEPASPVILGSARVRSTFERVFLVRGGIAYLASDGLTLADVSDPARPVLLGRISAPSPFKSISVHGDRAYLAGGERMSIVDTSDPERLVQVGSYEYPGDHGFVRVAAGEGVVFLTLDDPGQRGVHVIDVRDPEAAAPIGFLPMAEAARNIERVGDVLLIGTFSGAGRVYFVDVRDVTDPIIIGSVDTPSIFGGIDLGGDKVYGGMLQAGLGVIDVSFCLDDCVADWDGSGAVNAGDVGAFLSDYFLDLQKGTVVADFNSDGVTNAADVGAYLSVYFPAQGACP